MQRLDPTLDVVFKLLLTREPELLRDMLQGILARPVGAVQLVDPEIPTDRPGDKRSIFDVRALLGDRSRIDLEMQRRTTTALIPRLVFYAARDYASQLRRGDSYHLLTPTTGIVWACEPIRTIATDFHSIFELRERHRGTRLCDQLALHVLQLPHARPQGPPDGYTAVVDRWARFFNARNSHEFDQLASEDPIMDLAKKTLEELSGDPRALRLALEREDELKLIQIERSTELREARLEGARQGRLKGQREGKRALLERLLGLRFGPLRESAEARLDTATEPQLDVWTDRVLTAPTLDDVFED